MSKQNEVYDGLMKLDSFTRRQIVNEYEGYLYIKSSIDTTSVEHFTERKFNMNEFYGGFILVLSIIAVIGYIF